MRLAKRCLGSGMICRLSFAILRNLIVLDPLYSLITMDLLLTITVHLYHMIISAPTIRRSLGDIMERQQLFVRIINLKVKQRKESDINC